MNFVTNTCPRISKSIVYLMLAACTGVILGDLCLYDSMIPYGWEAFCSLHLDEELCTDIQVRRSLSFYFLLSLIRQSPGEEAWLLLALCA